MSYGGTLTETLTRNGHNKTKILVREEKSIIAPNLTETSVDFSQENEKEIRRTLWLRDKFQLEESEKLLESCSAALVRKILLQGRLYVTSRNLIFYWRPRRSFLRLLIIEVEP